MSKIVLVRMTLTGALAGKTTTLNKRRFISGVHEVQIHEQFADNLRKYFTRAYQVKFEINPGPIVEEVEEVELPEMDERQEAVLAALNMIPLEHWDGDLPVPHPPVTMVADLTNDARLTRDELVTVIEIWYHNQPEVEVEEAPEEQPEVEVEVEEAPEEEAPVEDVQEAPEEQPEADGE